jgi:pSer/pThr/pTyr-binding forkhead associated (FHA) protein
MAKLILSMDGLVLKEISLDKERLTIGRKPHNDIQIDNLAISGEHAVVVTILSDSFLEDLDSTNGTLVNGQAIKKHFLRHNDVVELGKYKLKYMGDAFDASVNNDFGKTGAGLTDTSVKRQEVPDSEPHLPAASIQLLNGANAGKTLALTKTLTSLGKPGVQVAVIARRPSGYFVTHAEGSIFPIVNGMALDAQAHALKDHDILEIAGIKMEFFLKR